MLKIKDVLFVGSPLLPERADHSGREQEGPAERPADRQGVSQNETGQFLFQKIADSF